MSINIAAMPRVAVCTAIVGALVFASGCAKKEAQQAETTEQTQTEEPAVAETPMVAGTYVAQIGDSTTGSTVTVTLNDDNTATVTVAAPGGLPGLSQSGTWAMGEMENMINFNYGAADSTMTMPMHLEGDSLHLGGDLATQIGASGVPLVREGAATGTTEDPEAGSY